MPDEAVEDFAPSSGRITGVLGLGICVAIVVLGVVESDDGFPAAVVWAALFGAVLFWSATLRPRVRVIGSELRMRSMLTTISVPLAAIEQIVVRQVLAVWVGDRRYISSAVGQDLAAGAEVGPRRASRRTTRRTRSSSRSGSSQLAEEARAKAGITLMSDEQLALARGVRREWAWPEIVLLGFTALGFVVALLA